MAKPVLMGKIGAGTSECWMGDFCPLLCVSSLSLKRYSSSLKAGHSLDFMLV